ncbi:hypothetical protein F5Y12DRAFT_796608 [Xylaria sp. FL1777]|nr:hypothetical protein F5Y12DRAFT_796608 [Xylaria sp. FL1777]
MSSSKPRGQTPTPEFWEVFIEEIPRVPTVDELICRVVAINYPEGIVTDRNGAYISPPRDASTVTTQILSTLKTAIETERNFWLRQLPKNGIFTPYAWGVKLSANIAIGEAENKILDALECVGNIDRLDKLFWESFHVTERFCQQDGRSIQWAPFKR